jgi:hypothetical protein
VALGHHGTRAEGLVEGLYAKAAAKHRVTGG